MTSLALQIHGGMGYVEETGAAQHFRDARIAPIYEGTNGIQAADLVGRKLGMRSGGVITDLLDEFDERSKAARTPIGGMGEFGDAAARGRRRCRAPRPSTSSRRHPTISVRSSARRARTSGCSARRCAPGCSRRVHSPPTRATTSAAAKRASARFFGEQILPTASGLLPAITADADLLYALDATTLASR